MMMLFRFLLWEAPPKKLSIIYTELFFLNQKTTNSTTSHKEPPAVFPQNHWGRPRSGPGQAPSPASRRSPRRRQGTARGRVWCRGAVWIVYWRFQIDGSKCVNRAPRFWIAIQIWQVRSDSEWLKVGQGWCRTCQRLVRFRGRSMLIAMIVIFSLF